MSLSNAIEQAIKLNISHNGLECTNINTEIDCVV